MDIQQLLDSASSFYHRYPIFCYVAGALIILVVLWKPRKALKNLLLLLVLGLILYIGLTLVSSVDFGIAVKDKAIHRTEKEIEKL